MSLLRSVASRSDVACVDVNGVWVPDIECPDVDVEVEGESLTRGEVAWRTMVCMAPLGYQYQPGSVLTDLLDHLGYQGDRWKGIEKAWGPVRH